MRRTTSRSALDLVMPWALHAAANSASSAGVSQKVCCLCTAIHFLVMLELYHSQKAVSIGWRAFYC